MSRRPLLSDSLLLLSLKGYHVLKAIAIDFRHCIKKVKSFTGNYLSILELLFYFWIEIKF